MTASHEVLAIERNFWTEGPGFYRENVDATCLVVFKTMSAVMTNAELAATVDSAPRWQDVHMVTKGIVSPQPGVVIVTYRASAARADGQRYVAFVSSGYVNRDGQWKMMFHQQTPLDDA